MYYLRLPGGHVDSRQGLQNVRNEEKNSNKIDSRELS